MDAMMLVANRECEKYDVWTLADAAEYVGKQEKKLKRYKREARAILKSIESDAAVGGIKWMEAKI